MTRPERAAPHPARRTTPQAPATRPALALVPPQAPRPHRSPLALWHLLSLDAPTVAALWTFAIARVSGLHLPWTSPAAMFVAVWMLYAADRILDARILDARLLDARPLANSAAPLDLEERHRFHHRHRRIFLFATLPAACALATLLLMLDPRALHLYALLAALLGAWFLLIHARPSPAAHRLPKELAVGIFFPAAAFIPTVARLPQLRLELLPPALLFASICTLNCLFVYAWEHPGPRTHAHWTTRFGTNHLTTLATLLALASAALIITSILHTSPRSHAATLLASCTLLSASLLLLLHLRRHHLKSVHLRALADLVLLTPLLILPLAHILTG
jgi:hypothetical protein